MKEKADVVHGWLRKAASDIVALEAARGGGPHSRGLRGSNVLRAIRAAWHLLGSGLGAGSSIAA